jgi:Zn-dependent protease with chaperone function
MSNIIERNRLPRERAYGTIALILGPSLWVLIVLGVLAAMANPQAASLVSVYVVYAILIAIGYWVAAAAYRAGAFGNMILLGPEQLPHLHAMVLDGARELGMNPPPKTFLFNSNGVLNAFARRLLGGRYVFLTSALVEADSDEQVRFVIGHELGHHAAGHLSFIRNFLRLPAYLIPFLQPAYSRAREYTCDGIGAELTKDAGISRSSLLMLGCGCGRVNGALNCEVFLRQEAMVPPIFGFLTEIFRSHPRLTRRVGRLTDRGARLSS